MSDNQPTRNGIERREEKFAYIIMAPLVMFLAITILYPLLWGAWTSFTDKSIGSTGKFIGLKNYRVIISDWEFQKALFNTFIYTVFAVFLKVVFGMGMALIVNSAIKARNVFRALLLLPWTIPTLISALTWKWMFSDIGGVIPYYSSVISRLSFIPDPIPWLVDPHWAMVSVIIVNAWRGVPFLGISILAGLQTIPSELFEAARVDGASKKRTFFQITLPNIRDIVLLATLVTSIWTLNDFELVWIITRGGPVFGTHLLSTYSYKLGFQAFQLARSIAVSVILIPFLILLVNKITSSMLRQEKII